MAYNCVLYDRGCIECGECDICDLDNTKRCTDCEKCISGSGEYSTVDVNKFFKDEKQTIKFTRK